MNPDETLHTNIASLPAVLTASSMPHRDLDQQARTGTLVRVALGAYMPASFLESNPAGSKQHSLARIAASAFRAGPSDILSHQSAALLWGFPEFGASKFVHIFRPLGSNYRKVGHKVRTAALDPADIHSLGQLRLTSFARTALDLASVVPPAAGLAVLDFALARGATPESMELTLARYSGTHLARNRKLLSIADGKVDSPSESIARYWMHQAGLHSVQTQVLVRCGNRNFYLDCGVPEIKMAVEYDGRGKYDSVQSLYDEKLREDAIRSLGWTFVRLTAADMRNPVALVARLRHIAAQLGWEG